MFTSSSLQNMGDAGHGWRLRVLNTWPCSWEVQGQGAGLTQAELVWAGRQQLSLLAGSSLSGTPDLCCHVKHLEGMLHHKFCVPRA